MFKAAANPYDDVVAKATDENQTSEDWGILATVWDKVNDDGATGARNCILAIQKRLQHRNANVQLYALTLSDALVNNCKIDLHREISSRAFTQTLTRMVQDRTTHDKVRKRVMQLLKEWSQSFKKDTTLGIVEETYDSLKKTYRAGDEPQARPESSSHRLMKQEEEDMQRAIAESEALAKQQQQRQGYVPSSAPAVNNYASSGQFFNSSDAKALPSIQPQASTSQIQPAPQQQPTAPAQPTAPSRVKALYDFEPQEEGELAFRRGDVIRVVNSAYEGWWKGELDGRVGIFPLTYIEIIPDPTPDSIMRDAEVEAQVFAQAGSVDRLLSMLSAADAQGSSISEDDDLMELYQQCILLRPKIVKLLDKYSQKQKDLSSLHDKWKVAKNAYDSMLEESYQRSQAQAPSRYAGYGPAQQGQPMPQAGQMPPQQHRHPSFGQPVLAQYAPPVDQPPVQSGPGYGPPGGTQYQYGPPQQQQLPQPGAPYAGEQMQGAYRPGPPQNQTSIPYVPSQALMQSPPQIVVDPHVRSISPGNISQQQPGYDQPQAGMFQHQTAQQRAQANGYN